MKWIFCVTQWGHPPTHSKKKKIEKKLNCATRVEWKSHHQTRLFYFLHLMLYKMCRSKRFWKSSFSSSSSWSNRLLTIPGFICDNSLFTAEHALKSGSQKAYQQNWIINLLWFWFSERIFTSRTLCRSFARYCCCAHGWLSGMAVSHCRWFVASVLLIICAQFMLATHYVYIISLCGLQNGECGCTCSMLDAWKFIITYSEERRENHVNRKPDPVILQGDLWCEKICDLNHRKPLFPAAGMSAAGGWCWFSIQSDSWKMLCGTRFVVQNLYCSDGFHSWINQFSVFMLCRGTLQ